MIRAATEKLLPGGKVRIHFLVRVGEGKPSPMKTAKGPMDAPVHQAFAAWNGGQWEVACGKDPTPRLGNDGRTHIIHRTDEASAATCPECKATEAYKAATAAKGE